MTAEDQRRATAAREAIAREDQVRAAELVCWDAGVAHIREGIGPWRPDRETYQWAVRQNRAAAEQYVDLEQQYADRERE